MVQKSLGDCIGLVYPDFELAVVENTCVFYWLLVVFLVIRLWLWV